MEPEVMQEPTELDLVMCEFATIEYDFKVHPEAARRIEELFRRLHVKDAWMVTGAT